MFGISIEHYKIMVTKPASELLKLTWHRISGPGLLLGLPGLPSPQSASRLTARSDRGQWEAESQSLMASLLEAFILSVAEGTPIHLNLIPAFCSTWANWYSLCWEKQMQTPVLPALPVHTER